MKNLAAPHLQQQASVNAYFRSGTSYWKDVYARGDVEGEIIRERHAAVLDWVDGLGLAAGSHVLEIGCGAGFLAVALAQRGFRVNAIDSTETMVALARSYAEKCGANGSISIELGDAYSLAYDTGAFDLVIAIGVIPWLEQPELAIQAMARVAKPEGYVILTADNRARLTALLDPWLNPALTPLKRGVKNLLDGMGIRRWSLKDMGSTLHDRHFIDSALRGANLIKIKSKTIGFGPFSLFRRAILPAPLGTQLHHGLQRLADRGAPGLRSAGTHYLVLARKSAATPAE